MRKFKLSKFEVKKGFWKYKEEILTNVDMKKGDQSFEIPNDELYEDKESLKIGTMIYDVEKVEEGKVFLKEPIIEDFLGYVVYEWSLPIVLRKGLEHNRMMLQIETDLPRKSRKVVPVARMDKKSKVMWMEIIKEEKGDVDPATISVTMIDDIEEKVREVEFKAIRDIAKNVVHIDMDYKDETGKDLWTIMNIKKGNYVAVIELLTSPEVGILADDMQIAKLQYTIEAIEKDEDVDLYVAKKIADLASLHELLKLRAQFKTEEDYNQFVSAIFKSAKKEEENVWY